MKRRITNEKIKREHDPIPWLYCILTLFCGLFLVVGFFWAARQHFSAMDLGMKNSELRRQKENLVSEQRLLERNREVSLTPAEITKAAKKIGLQDLTAESFEVISSVKEKIIPSNQSPTKTFVAKSSKVEKSDETKKSDAAKVAEKTKETKPQVSAATDTRERIAKK